MIALLDGACGDAQFTSAKLASADVQGLLDKVTLQEDAELSALWPGSAGGAVELHLRGGGVRSHRCPHPPGSPHFPLADEELVDKFHGYADPVLGRAGAERLRQAVNDLDACDDLRDFARLFGPRRSSNE